MTEADRPSEEPPYWTVDEAIGEVILWRSQRYILWLTAHIQDEVYRQGRDDELILLRQQRGVRTYVQAKAYVLVPDITLAVQLTDRPDPTGAIGSVQNSTWEGMRHEEVGQAQAWYYGADRVIVLWEAYLLDRYRTPPLLDDPNTYALWQGFERFLTSRFPSAQTIVTTHADPEYEPTQTYQTFLTSLGYRQLSARAFGKPLLAEER